MVKEVKVSINNVIYKSITEAAKTFGWHPVKIHNAYRRGKATIEGMPFEKITTTEIKNKKSNKKQSCPVTCTTTNTIYNTITEAAKAAGVPMWTMSLKMDAAGKFIDKQGNEYVRQKPMKKRTTRDYGKQTANITRNIIRTVSKRIKPEVVNIPIETVGSASTSTLMLSNIERVTLRNVAKDFLEKDNYIEASNILNILIRNNNI